MKVILTHQSTILEDIFDGDLYIYSDVFLLYLNLTILEVGMYILWL